MASFCKAKELESRYLVSAPCLLRYAQRGNLAMRMQGGELFFDEHAVARLFRRRAQATEALGVLGACRLGTSDLG